MVSLGGLGRTGPVGPGSAKPEPDPDPDPDAADTLGDEYARVRLAANPQTAPDILCELASDPRVTVRAVLATNPAAPDGVDARLAGDADERVRTLLARKLAGLIPHLSQRSREHLEQNALATLTRLVACETERVRQAVADVVKDMPEAPRDLILLLARDSALPVSEPILRLSPVLTTTDLLQLLASPPTPLAVQAIAARAGLDPATADAVAQTDDEAAICTLLQNGSAQLREAALDALAERAVAHESWHDPMVRRSRLSPRAAATLSDFVATHLLTMLASRADLPSAVALALRQRLSQRLADEARRARGDDRSIEDAIHHARALKTRGQLNDAAVTEAASLGEARTCIAMLAVGANVPGAVVARAARLRNAKAVVSLCWSAGLSVETALLLQEVVGQVAPAQMLRSPNGRDYPLAPDEMRWQVDLLRRAR